MNRSRIEEYMYTKCNGLVYTSAWRDCEACSFPAEPWKSFLAAALTQHKYCTSVVKLSATLVLVVILSPPLVKLSATLVVVVILSPPLVKSPTN